MINEKNIYEMQLWLQKPLLRFRGVILLISLDIRADHFVIGSFYCSTQSPVSYSWA